MSIDLSTRGLAVASSKRPWITVAIWIVLIVGAGALNGTLLADALTTEFALTNNPDSQLGDQLLEDRLRGPRKANEVVLIQSENLTADDEAFRSKVSSVYTKILGVGQDKVAGGVNYYLIGDESLVSADRKTTMMPFSMTGSFDDATKNVEELIDIVAEENGHDGFRVLIAGDSSIAFESNELSIKEIEQGERIGVPMALLILLVLFGAVIAALIPLGLAIVSIIVALAARPRII